MHNKFSALNKILASMWLCAACGAGILGSAPPMFGADDYEKQLKAEEAARAKDPAWTTTHKQTKVIQVGKKNGGTFNNFCLDRAGNILACLGTEGLTGSKSADNRIQVVSPEGKLLNEWPLPTAPQAIAVDSAGTIFVGGGGRLYKLAGDGKILASAESPVLKAAATAEAKAAQRKQLETSVKSSDSKMAATQLKKLVDDRLKYMEGRKANVTGLAVTDQDVFVACPSPSDFTYDVYRFTKALESPTKVLTGLRGCCGQMDVQANKGNLWVAHNARHKVECYNREGKAIVDFGKFDRKLADCFGGCCEPKNLRFGSNGDVFAAETGPPVAIKHFDAKGKFQGVVALPKFDSGCVRATVEISPDGQRFYVMNPSGKAIHVMEPKK